MSYSDMLNEANALSDRLTALESNVVDTYESMIAEANVLSVRVSALEDTAPPVDVPALHTLTFSNTAATSSRGLVKFGLAFEKGDIPSTQVAKVRIAGGANLRGYPVDVATWSDGSMRKCTMVVDLGSVAGSGSTAIEVYNETGTVPLSTLNPVTFISGLSNDHTINLTNHNGFASGALGDRAFGLKAASAASTRREVQADTPLFVRYFCWQSLTGDDHLVCLNYLDIWLDTDGSTVVAMDWVPVLSQHWWVNDPTGAEQTKERRTYDAVVKVGATTVDSRSTLSHAYYCQWASLYSADDAQHATPHWINVSSATKPTLSVTYSTASRKKMARVSGYLPPLKWDDTGWPVDLTFTYVPLGINGHRAQINNVGAYNGRGPITRYDSSAITLQTSTQWRNMRVAAQAGLAVFNSVYDHRVIDTEASPRFIPQKRRVFGATTYPGMAIEAAHALLGQSADNDAGSRDILVDNPVGGSGSFAGYGTDHGVNYAAFAAFITGERYLADSAMSPASLCLSSGFMNIFGHNKAFDGYSAETTPRHGVVPSGGAARGRAWAANMMSWAWAVMGDANPNKLYLENMLKNLDAFHSVSHPKWDQGRRDWGGWIFNDPHYYSPWMSNWMAMVYSQWLPHFTDMGFGAGFRVASNAIMKPVKRAMDANRISALGAYVWRVPSTPWTDTELGIFVQSTGSWSGDDLTVGASIAENDRFMWMGVNSSNGNSAYPTQTDFAQVYYLINVSGSTCNLSLTPGGSAVTFSGSGNFSCGLDLAAFDEAVSSVVFGGDSQAVQAMSALVAAYMEGSQGVTLGHVNSYRTFLSTSNRAGYGPWNFSEEQT